MRSFIESEKIAKPPLGIASKVYLYPVSKDIFVPDLIIFLVNAEQVSRLITLAQFWDGKTPSFEMKGSLCWSSITYPVVSGNFNVTAGDISARRMVGWDKNTMFASVPVEKIRGIADAIDKSTAGTAKPSSQFIKMTESMMIREKITWTREIGARAQVSFDEETYTLETCGAMFSLSLKTCSEEFRVSSTRV